MSKIIGIHVYGL